MGLTQGKCTIPPITGCKKPAQVGVFAQWMAHIVAFLFSPQNMLCEMPKGCSRHIALIGWKRNRKVGTSWGNESGSGTRERRMLQANWMSACRCAYFHNVRKNSVCGSGAGISALRRRKGLFLYGSYMLLYYNVCPSDVRTGTGTRQLCWSCEFGCRRRPDPAKLLPFTGRIEK